MGWRWLGGHFGIAGFRWTLKTDCQFVVLLQRVHAPRHLIFRYAGFRWTFLDLRGLDGQFGFEGFIWTVILGFRWTALRGPAAAHTRTAPPEIWMCGVQMDCDFMSVGFKRTICDCGFRWTFINGL